LTSIAYFITPHGFGHATRACAVMAALQAGRPDVRFEIFTQVPRWVFADSLTGSFDYHPLYTDVGLVQLSPMVEDVPGTIQRLSEIYPFREAQVRSLAQQIRQLGCQAVLCDVAPLGIAVAKAAGVPSVLIENFTWDWIYETYAAEAPGLWPYIEYLRSAFAAADHHIQTAPVCAPRAVDFTTPPVSRSPRTPIDIVRERLSIPAEAKAILLTMGGIEPEQYRFLDQLPERDIYFVIPGGGRAAMERVGNAILLPHHSQFFHPDLLNACDAVVGKLGYSTVAEAYHAGVPFGYVPRSRLRESELLGSYVQRELNGIEISSAEFGEGRWLDVLPDLRARPRIKRNTPNGAVQIAKFVKRLVE
jgi:UDP:flavonoid glycosyltransferase YjiC (YdhE family)